MSDMNFNLAKWGHYNTIYPSKIYKIVYDYILVCDFRESDFAEKPLRLFHFSIFHLKFSESMYNLLARIFLERLYNIH